MEDGAGPTDPGPHVDPDTGAITFVGVEDDGVRPLRVWYHLRSFGDDPTFRPDLMVRPDGGRWVARIPAPPVDRMEYLLVVCSPAGDEWMALDPANPHRAAGVFGDHSVLELPGYRAPDWVASASPPWGAVPVSADTPVAGLEVRGELLTPPGFTDDDPLPLLVVHDGPEYIRLARLLDYLGWLAEGQPSLRCRVLSLQPVDRDRSYAASDVYTDALVRQAIPHARTLAPTVGETVGLGASLGALALTYAAATHPGTFAGLMCQSGSFFRPEFDAHERRWPLFDDVVAATARLDADPSGLGGVAIRLTAGLGEENLENNRALAVGLRAAGIDATITEGRDGHNYTAWRDLLHPTLGDLLAICWGSPGRA